MFCPNFALVSTAAARRTTRRLAGWAGLGGLVSGSLRCGLFIVRPFLTSSSAARGRPGRRGEAKGASGGPRAGAGPWRGPWAPGSAASSGGESECVSEKQRPAVHTLRTVLLFSGEKLAGLGPAAPLLQNYCNCFRVARRPAARCAALPTRVTHRGQRGAARERGAAGLAAGRLAAS